MENKKEKLHSRIKITQNSSDIEINEKAGNHVKMGDTYTSGRYLLFTHQQRCNKYDTINTLMIYTTTEEDILDQTIRLSYF